MSLVGVRYSGKEPNLTAPAGLIVCRWQNSLPHAFLMSSGFRGINRRLYKERTQTKQPFKVFNLGSYWRRERDLNPWIHSCITRFRIVRVRPLRHLCIDSCLTSRAGERAAFVVPKRTCALTAPPSLQAVLL